MAEPFVTTQQLRFCDTDQIGHVNNSVYSVLYEAGRVELVRALGLMGGPLKVVIVRLEIDFVREINWPGEVRVETAVARIGTKSMHMRQQLLLHGEVASRSRSVLAAIDPATRRAVAIPQDWRDALAAHIVMDDSIS
jgi:acyl-CoA thioester hydrolase